MSDRFYTQLVEYFDIAPWELNRAFWDKESKEYKSLERKSMPKITRKELNNELNELLAVDIIATKLPMPTLQFIVETVRAKKVKTVSMPTGRLKAPYIEALHTALGVPVKDTKLDFSPVTVALMKEILESLK